MAFTITDEMGYMLYGERIVIGLEEETEFGAIYSAALEEGEGLILLQSESQPGAIVTEWSNSAMRRHAAGTE